MKIAVAQLNPTVGDIRGNLSILMNEINRIPAGAADLIVTPELFLCGYPPRDLLNFPWFIDKLQDALSELIQFSTTRPDLGILVGTVRKSKNGAGKGLYNSAFLIENGTILFTQDKQLLPTYDVFDEYRYFNPGSRSKVYEFRGVKLGISICEDAWNDYDFEKTHEYDINPIEQLAKAGAEIMINLSASPYHRDKEINRYKRFAFHASKWSVPFYFVAQIGANDELIFDGQSLVIDKEGELVANLAPFDQEVRIINSKQEGIGKLESLHSIESIRLALVLGVKDYMRKSGFKTAVLGLSGGIDSAVTACIAVDALGAENVRGITMPSMYSSEGSVSDSLVLAEHLGIQCDSIPIKNIYDEFVRSLEAPFAGLDAGVTEENLQARIRGTLLMSYSNKFGSILLTTGNKSELAVGYCTLYGDMNGGLAVISDLPKTTVYELAKWYNRDREIIPSDIITKPPSAELRPDQKDQDSLPDYDVLDDILEMYLERRCSFSEIVANGHDPDIVKWVVRTVDLNEYKRKQAAPGLRVTSKAFGSGRRMPIAGKWTMS